MSIYQVEDNYIDIYFYQINWITNVHSSMIIFIFESNMIDKSNYQY